MIYIEKTIEEKNEFHGDIIDVNTRKVKLIDGKIFKREIVNHPGGVAILAYKTNDTILFVEQFRNPIQKTLLEIPAGKLEYGEDPESCAKRELEEETGYKAKNFTYLGKIVTTPGFCDEYIYIFKAEDLYEGVIGGDEDEFIDLHEFNINEVKKMIRDGKIIDSKTICSFMLL